MIPRLSPCEVATAAVLRMAGSDTRDISLALCVPEPSVWNAGDRIVAVVRAAAGPTPLDAEDVPVLPSDAHVRGPP